MVDLSIDDIRTLMSRPDNIRNISCIIESDHGGPGVIDVLNEHAGISLSQATAGNEPAPDIRHIHEIDVKHIPVPLYARVSHEDGVEGSAREIATDDYLINLLDCSDHVSFSPEGGCSALRNTDGVIVVLDCRKGMSLQAQTVFRQALNASLKPIVFIDNLESVLLEKELSKEVIYQHFVQLIESINNIILPHHHRSMGDPELCPSKDNVVFGSTNHGWAFTVRQFASKYTSNFEVDQPKLCRRLWGNWFFHSGKQEWHRNGNHNERAFNRFVLGPLCEIYEASERSNQKELAELAKKLGVIPTLSEQKQQPSDLLKMFMHSFLPIANTFTESIVRRLPSPAAAQQYRTDDLYGGGQKDEIHHCIKDCVPDADLMFSVSSVVSAMQDKKTLYVVGRIFSGTIRQGLKVRIQGGNYISGRREDLYIKTIEMPMLLVGRIAIPVTEIPVGNFAGLFGIAEYITRGRTITTSQSAENLTRLPHIWNYTIHCSVEVVNPNDLPELISGLKGLAKRDTNIETSVTESGYHLLSGFSEQHLRVRSKQLQEHFAGVPLEVSKPFVGYRESVRQRSSMTALSKTPNKFSRFWVTAEPLNEGLSRAIEDGEIAPRIELNARTRILTNNYGWNENDARRIWTFGPDSDGANVVVDMTTRVQYLNEIKDSFISGFTWASRAGPIAEEPLRSIRLNILDVTLFSDAIHRGGGQVIPTARRVTYAATLLADPVLMEPMYHIEIQTPSSSTAQVSSALVNRRGRIISQQVQTGILKSLSLVRAYVPVMESFDLSNTLYNDTSTRVSPNMVFDHWQAIPGSLWSSSTKAGEVAVNIRRRKGLSEAVPDHTQFHDKL